MTDLPVIILNWNGFNDTIETVDSVLNQRFHRFVIYLVDNGSDNQEFERLKAKYSNNSHIILLKNDVNQGFTIAHNQLFELIKSLDSEYVALLNNDAVADTFWLENALKIATNENADIIACKMLNYYDRNLIDSNGLYLLSSGEILPLFNGENSNSSTDARKLIGASAGACLYRLSMLKEIGTFDPYFSTGYEDAELGLRALLAGKKLTFAPESIVYHKVSRSVSKIIDQKRIQKIQEDINYTYLKLMPVGAIAINALINIPRTLIVLLIHFITLRFKFLRCQLMATVRTLSNLKLIGIKRSEFRNLRKLKTCDIIKVQHFSLTYDLTRFYRYIVKGKKNQFEKY